MSSKERTGLDKGSESLAIVIASGSVATIGWLAGADWLICYAGYATFLLGLDFVRGLLAYAGLLGGGR